MEGYCRGCLQKQDPTELTPYNEKNRRLFVYSTGIQVKKTDTFTFQLCKECYLNMKQSCKFKKQCRTTDKKFKSYMSLKEIGDSIDFDNFIKNNEEPLTLRIPLASGNSTPVHQKQKDDDNESTCTSIRNFMTDMLQGEEVPATEARIIRELIEEEADIYEDSLDSHWLDDMSIDTDFRMDFAFSPFSTPRSVDCDHCYTPRRLDDEKQHKYYSPKNLNTSFDMPLLDCEMDIDNPDMNNDNYCDKVNDRDKVNDHNDFVEENHEFSIDSEIEVTTDFETIEAQDNGIQNKDAIINETNKNYSNDMLNNNESLDFVAPTNNENDLYELGNQENESSPLADELEYYINKAEIKKKNKVCTIDRNLEAALRNGENKEFALDQLLASPRVSINSGASTPTIRNILFGDSDTTYGTKIETHKPVEGQINILTLLNDTSNIDLVTVEKSEEKKQNLDAVNENIEAIKENMEAINEDSIDIDKLLAVNETELKLDKIEFNEDLFKRPFSPADDKYDLKSILCKICDKKYDSRRALKVHFSKYHKVIIKDPNVKRKVNYLCKHCGKQYNNIQNLSRHIRLKHREKEPIENDSATECPSCFLTFSNQSALNKHMRKHSDNINNKDNKKFVCSTCGKTFNTAANRHLHEMRHNKTYQFTCEICHKGFYRRTDLVAHTRTHTGERPYECNYCDQTFSRRDVLTNHVKKHLANLDYRCSECDAVFVVKSRLKKHLHDSDCGRKMKSTSVEYVKVFNEEICNIIEQDTDVLNKRNMA